MLLRRGLSAERRSADGCTAVVLGAAGAGFGRGQRAPDGAPTGQPDVEDESEDEVTWTLTSGGATQGWVSAMRGSTGWVIHAYSRPRR